MKHCLGPDRFTDESYQILKAVLTLILLKPVISRKEKSTTKLSYKTSISILPDKDIKTKDIF